MNKSETNRLRMQEPLAPFDYGCVLFGEDVADAVTWYLRPGDRAHAREFHITLKLLHTWDRDVALC